MIFAFSLRLQLKDQYFQGIQFFALMESSQVIVPQWDEGNVYVNMLASLMISDQEIFLLWVDYGMTNAQSYLLDAS